MHTPVLLQQTLDALKVQRGGLYIDCTFGAGGHAYEIAKRGGKVLAIDYDKRAVEEKKNEAKVCEIELVYGNYADIETIAEENGFKPCSGILFDLGLSMEQIGQEARGFSYKKERAPLDMRLSTDIDLTAAEIVTNYSEEQLYETLVGGAEELNSRPIVQSIIKSRRLKPIRVVGDLNEAIKLSGQYEKGNLEKVLRRVYQALFIEVNNEYENLRSGLQGAVKCIDTNGVIAVICFHAGHDRIVKRFAKQERLRSKSIKGSHATMQRYERSATLRILQKYA